jgi:hypothetical protein
MSPSHIKRLQIVTWVMLVLLFAQYELGITTAMANPASLHPFGFSITAFKSALEQIGLVAVLHASVGGGLLVVSVANLILVISSKVKLVVIFGILSFISIAFAAGGGLFFVLSGFQNDNASHAMATNFLLSYTFSLLELHFARPAPK